MENPSMDVPEEEDECMYPCPYRLWSSFDLQEASFLVWVKILRADASPTLTECEEEQEQNVMVHMNDKCFVVRSLEGVMILEVPLENCSVRLQKDFILQTALLVINQQRVKIRFSNLTHMNEFSVAFRNEIPVSIEYTLPPCDWEPTAYTIAALTALVESVEMDDTVNVNSFISAFEENDYIEHLLKMFMEKLEALNEHDKRDAALVDPDTTQPIELVQASDNQVASSIVAFENASSLEQTSIEPVMGDSDNTNTGASEVELQELSMDLENPQDFPVEVRLEQNATELSDTTTLPSQQDLESNNSTLGLDACVRLIASLEDVQHLLSLLLKMNLPAFNETFFSAENILNTVSVIETRPWIASDVPTHRRVMDNYRVREIVPLASKTRRHIKRLFQLEYLANIVMDNWEWRNHPVRRQLKADLVLEKHALLKKYIRHNGSEYIRHMIRLLKKESTPDETRLEVFKFLTQCFELGNEKPLTASLLEQEMLSYKLLKAITHTLVEHTSVEVKTVAMAVLYKFPLKAMRSILSDKASRAQEVFRILLLQLHYTTVPGFSLEIFALLERILKPGSNDSDLGRALYLYQDFCLSLELVTECVLKKWKRTSKEDRDSVKATEPWSYYLRVIGIVIQFDEHDPEVVSIAYVLSKAGLLAKIVAVAKSRQVFLRLEVINLLKLLIDARIELYVQLIINDNLLAPILETYIAEYGGKRCKENIFTSSIHSLFECILDISDREMSELMVNYVVEGFGHRLASCRCVSYLYMKSRYEYYLSQSENPVPVPLQSDSVSGKNQECSVDNVCEAFPSIQRCGNKLKDVLISDSKNDNNTRAFASGVVEVELQAHVLETLADFHTTTHHELEPELCRGTLDSDNSCEVDWMKPFVTMEALGQEAIRIIEDEKMEIDEQAPTVQQEELED